MRSFGMISGLSVILFSFTALPAIAEDPWADTVLSANAYAPAAGFTDPSETLGAPTGGGVYAPNNSKAYCLGKPGANPGSYILLKFNTPVEDDPANPMGIDFVVHGNAFWAGGNPNRRWAEPALVEISEDVNGNGLADDPWYRIPGSRNLTGSMPPEGIANPTPSLAGTIVNTNTDGSEQDWGYADLSPTITPYRDNYLRPDDPMKIGITPGSGGGDAFDIAWAIKEDGTAAGLSRFHFIRLRAFINGSIAGFGAVSPEISAVVDMEPDTDTDADGITDAYETRVAGTDPNRPENTVLPLEIPSEFGGSAAGVLLGIAADASGNALELHSSGLRSGNRAYNTVVDILAYSAATPAIAGKLKSGACRQFIMTTSSFSQAQIGDGRFTLAYRSSDITGLDESSLEVYRLEGAAWIQAGIHDVQRNTAENKVDFYADQAGVFILASSAGIGDTHPAKIPLTLTAAPSGGIVADGLNTVTLSSDPIMDGEEAISDGTLLQVFLLPDTLAVSTEDADPSQEGIQTRVASGRVQLTLRSTTAAGTAHIRIADTDGIIAGELDYPFLAGSPEEPADLWPMNPNATAPGPIDFATSPINDAFGNRVSDGTLLTLVVEGGRPTGTDASLQEPGFQVKTAGGIVTFSILTDSGEDSMRSVGITLFADTHQNVLIASGDFFFEYVKMSISDWMEVLLLGSLLLLGAGYIFSRKRRRTV